MTIQDNGTRDQYISGTSQTVFAYSFEIFDKDDIKVQQKVKITGITTTLAEGTDYTVSNVGNDNGGNVTLIVGAAINDIITLSRDMALERITDYQNSGDFLADTVNDDYDRLWAGLQQNETSLSLAVRAAIDDSVLNQTNTIIPDVATRKNTTFGFDLNGQIEYKADAFSIAVSDAKYFDTVSQATADTSLVAGGVAIIKDRADGIFDVISGTGTANTFDIIAHGTLSLSLQLRIGKTLFVKSIGITETGDQLAALNRLTAIVKATGILVDFQEQMQLETTGEWKIQGNFFRIYGRGTEILCSSTTSTDYAIAIDPDGGIYPVAGEIVDLVGVAEVSTMAGGWDIRCSSSTLRIQSQIKNNDQTCFNLEGDLNGTGPYYNTFINPRGQGPVGGTGTLGWDFGHDASQVTRSPNANAFIGGRIGQCVTNYHIEGQGNTFFQPVSEGATTTHFDFNNVDSSVGCVGNSVKGVYIEGDVASNPDAFVVGSNSIGSDIEATFITSIGSGAELVDTGQDTRFITVGQMSLPSKGMVISQEGTTEFPEVQGLLPSWLLTNNSSGKELLIQNNSNTSTSTQFLRVLDNLTSDILFKVGTISAEFMGNDILLANSALGIYSGSGTPESSQVAPVGSIFMRTDGGAGTSHYVKESGSGNTGWIAK